MCDVSINGFENPLRAMVTGDNAGSVKVFMLSCNPPLMSSPMMPSVLWPSNPFCCDNRAILGVQFGDSLAIIRLKNGLGGCPFDGTPNSFLNATSGTLSPSGYVAASMKPTDTDPLPILAAKSIRYCSVLLTMSWDLKYT